MECITVHRIARPCVTPENLKKSKQKRSKGNIYYKILWKVERVGGSQVVRKKQGEQPFSSRPPTHSIIEQREIKKPAYAYKSKHSQTNIKGV